MWRGLRKVIYLVPSNTAVAMVSAARRPLGETSSGETADSSAAAAHQPTVTGADAGTDHTVPPQYELNRAAPEYELKRAWLGTPTNSMTSQSARRSSGATKAAAEHEGSESEAAEHEGKEPSQAPANAPGEREILEAASSRDGDGSTVFI